MSADGVRDGIVFLLDETPQKDFFYQGYVHLNVHNNGDKNMGGLELLGFLAIVIGVIGLIVLLKSRKKSDR